MNRKCFYVAHIRPASHNPSPRSDLAAEPSKDSGGDYQPGHGGNPRLAGQNNPETVH